MPKVSVVMTTFNGEKYIKEQMDSIRTQSLEPDEVIICDDCSTDRTVNFIEDYIAHFQLKDWKLISNSVNKGWKRNFFDASKMSTGDVVFFSDQDDIWNRDKIEKLVTIMTQNEDVGETVRKPKIT